MSPVDAAVRVRKEGSARREDHAPFSGDGFKSLAQSFPPSVSSPLVSSLPCSHPRAEDLAVGVDVVVENHAAFSIATAIVLA